MAAADTARWGDAWAAMDGHSLTVCNALIGPEHGWQLRATFVVDGLLVHMLLDQAPGHTPDVLRVTAPPGYIAVPPRATMREIDCVTVLIVPEGLS